MPTGYTYEVQEGKITEFPDFAMQCARAFGALIMMRDDPPDAPIRPREVGDYHKNELADAQAELARYEAMTTEQADAEAEAAYQKACGYRRESEARCKLHRDRYEAMLAKVNEWTPPTTEHEGLKKFMVQQLTDSIKHDCNVYPEKPPRRETGAEWLAKAIKDAKWSIQYHEEGYAKDVKNANESNGWVEALRESLGQPA